MFRSELLTQLESASVTITELFDEDELLPRVPQPSLDTVPPLKIVRVLLLPLMPIFRSAAMESKVLVLTTLTVLFESPVL